MNKENLEVLWDTVTPKLYGYLINTLRDRALADDILQTTWQKAIEASPGFGRRGDNFSAWLFAIARNECKQHWRKGKREKMEVSFDSEIHDIEKADSGDEDRILVDQLLLQLSSDDRELVRLRYIADIPLNDIARILKINPITARVRMHRALAVLKTLLINNQ